MSVYNIDDFGALKNSGMLATEAIARAIEAASEGWWRNCLCACWHLLYGCDCYEKQY